MNYLTAYFIPDLLKNRTAKISKIKALKAEVLEFEALIREYSAENDRLRQEWDDIAEQNGDLQEQVWSLEAKLEEAQLERDRFAERLGVYDCD